MSKTIFDANCWCGFVDDQIYGGTGSHVKAFDLARASGTIHLDGGGAIRQQYLDARKGKGADLFDVFFEEGIISGQIRLTANPACTAVKRALKKLGVPPKESIYFQIACAEPCDYLVSDDIDFFDPKLKDAASKTKNQCKSKSSGPVCREFKKSHKLSIVSVASFNALAA